MKFEHRIIIEAPRQRVDELLADTQRAALCVPGVKEVKIFDDGWYEGSVHIKVGPLSMNFSGRARTEMTGAGVWRMQGEGRDRRIGSGVTAAVDARLSEVEPDVTEVMINAEMKFSGRLAELGQPLIRRKADSMVMEFVKNLEKALSGG